MKLERLISIISKVDDVEDIKIEKGHSLKDDLHMNSFSFMLLLVELEDELGCSIDPIICMQVNTVEDLYKKIQNITGEIL